MVVVKISFALVRRRNRGRHRGDKEKGGPAILTIRSMATESLHPSTDRRRRFLVCRSYQDYFPATEYASYDAFLNADGNPVKSEPRTRVVRLRRRVNGPQEAATRSFVSKPTIILCGRESGQAFASLRVSESSTVCVTLINRVCRPAETWDCFSTIFILP